MHTSTRLSPSLRFLLAAGSAVLLTLGVFALLMQPSGSDLELMALFLAVTAALSVAAAYGAYRLGWIQRSPRLRWTLLGGAALSSLLTFLNVWLTARLMFASLHDLQLATVLLLFAGGISMAFGYFFTETLTRRMTHLSAAAESLARGELATRAAVDGRDELAGLAQVFNAMAGQLEQAAARQREVETLRRELVAWASHDLQTPLASIRAMVEALADGVVDEPATVQRYLRTVQREIQSLSALMDDLFQMAQLDAGGLVLERGPASLADLISDTLESFSALAAQQGVRLSGLAEAGVDPVWMDTPRVGRVLSNLVSNALRHTPVGGEVRVWAGRSGGEVRVEVQDTGAGIPAQDLPRVFERFYRGEQSRSRVMGGAGLGLAIARGLVEAHGGRIWAESAPEGGARLCFSLPPAASP